MKTLFLLMITGSVMASILPFNTILAQNDTLPKIEFDNASYLTKEMHPLDDAVYKATITVTDPNANRFHSSIDRVTVYIWSDSDPRGIEITAHETQVDSGIFQGTVVISNGQSAQNVIHASDGDTLSAKYIYTTLSQDHKLDSHDLVTTSFIGSTGPPPERVPASSLRVLDNKGNEHKTIAVNHQAMIISDIINPTTTNQTFAYIVKIQDQNGSTASLAWLSGKMLPNQTFSPSVSWTPDKVGNYVVTVFVWESLTNPNALSPPLFTDLTVFHDSSSYQESAISDVENLHCKLGFELVTKSNNGSPACVTQDTASKLVKRGWSKVSTDMITSVPSMQQDQVTNLPSGLQLSLYVGHTIHTGQPIVIDMFLRNTLSKSVVVPVKNEWALKAAGLESCIPNPAGVAIFKEYYTKDNMTEGKLLWFYDPYVTCSLVLYNIENYQFDPLSSHAKSASCTSTSYEAICNINTSKHISIKGYWTLENGFHIFDPGNYTVVGAEQSGYTVIQHFAVVNSTKR